MKYQVLKLVMMWVMTVGIALGLYSRGVTEADTTVNEAENQESLVTIGANNRRLVEVAASISGQVSEEIIVHGNARNEKVFVLSENEPIEEVLNQFCKRAGLTWWEHNGIYNISDRWFFESQVVHGRPVDQVFRFKHISLDNAEELIETRLDNYYCSWIFDHRTRKLIVWVDIRKAPDPGCLKGQREKIMSEVKWIMFGAKIQHDALSYGKLLLPWLFKKTPQ